MNTQRLYKFTCSGFRAVYAQGFEDAARIFAARETRRFKGRVDLSSLNPINFDSYNEARYSVFNRPSSRIGGYNPRSSS